MKRKLKKYQVEFSDNVSRRYNDMPYNRIILAKNKEEAKRKVILPLRKQYPGNTMRIEGVFLMDGGKH